MAFLIGGANTLRATGYEITNSLRFDRADTPALSYSFSSTAASWTVSCWIKLAEISVNTRYPFSFGTAGTDAAGVSFASGDSMAYYDEDGNTLIRDTTKLVRDVSAWYHMVAKNSGGTVTIYLNGVQQATGSGGEALDGSTFYVGRFAGSTAYHWDGHISEFYFIDGTAYSPSDFAETDSDSGIWKPKEAVDDVTFGSDGIFLEFKQTGTDADSSGIGADTSGNDNHMTVSNLAATDVGLDTPTNNFPTLNPFGSRYTYNSDPITNAARLSQGNLVTLTRTSNTGDGNCMSTLALPNFGKWYAEFKIADANGDGYVGIRNPLNAKQVAYSGSNGNKAVDGTSSSYGNAYGNGHIVGMAIDIDNSKIYFSKDGTFQNSGDPTSGSTGTGAIGYDVAGLIDSDGGDYFIIIGDGGGSIGPVVQSNFGNPSFAVSSGNTDGNGIGNFEFAPPSGYLAFCTKNLSSSFTTIDDSSKYFQTTLYTGNGSADHAITNGGNSDLQPDWVWIKNRDAADSHCLFDSVRGVTKLWSSDDPAVQSTDGDTLDAFQSDGFRVDADVKVNTNAEKYVAWQWLCNGGTNETAVNESGNNPGNTRQTNTDAGFSIITYVGTGAAGTIAHGLGVRPDWIIVKGMDVATDSMVYHEYNTAAPETDALTLTEDAVTNDNAGWWNDTAPTSSVFTLGDHDRVNKNGQIYIAYCFAAKQGYSKFSSYKGNGSASGPFIYTGFKPAFVIQKQSSADGEFWMMKDSAREPFNLVDANLYPNATNVEGDTNGLDFLSTGFKCITTGAGSNANNATYVYIAFAESPFVTSTGIPTTAR